MPETIALTSGYVRDDTRDAAEILTPGELASINASGDVAAHAVAGGEARPVAFVLENELAGEGIDTDIAAGDQAPIGYFQPGSMVNALLDNTSGNASPGDLLESVGDGSLRVATGEAAVAASLTHGSGNAGLTVTADAAGSAGNAISLEILAPGTAAVAVEGLNIKVTPGTGADTAGDIQGQIDGNADAAALVNTSLVGDGTGTPGTLSRTFLSGGADGEIDNPVAMAEQSVTSPGAGRVRIKVRVL